MYTIIGIEKRQGVYEGNAYDNTILHCTYKKQNVNGLCVLSLKVKTVNAPDLKVGDNVNPMYDRFGNVVQLTIG